MAQINIDTEIRDFSILHTVYVINDHGHYKLWLEKSIKLPYLLNLNNEELTSYVIMETERDLRTIIKSDKLMIGKLQEHRSFIDQILYKLSFGSAIGLEENESLTVIEDLIKADFELKSVY